MQADVSLDCTGLYCPMPIYKTSRKVNELEPGQVLEVVADDEGILKDMPAWCESTGNEFLGQEVEADEYRVYIRKK